MVDNFVVKSPITGSQNIEVEFKLDTTKIVLDYKEKYGVDVSKYYDNIDSLNIYRCNDTGYRFYYPFSLAGKDDFYDKILENQDYYSKWKKEYQSAFMLVEELIKERSSLKVLDIGCGFGAFLERTKKLGAEVIGLEYNDTAVEYCKSKGLVVEKQSIEDHASKNKEKYDVICSFQVLEHVADVKSFINASITCLKPNGKLVIAVPNNEIYYAGYHCYAISNVPPHHMGLWNASTFQNIQRYFDLSLVKIDYDLSISLFYYLYFRSKYLLFKNNIVSNKIIISLLAIILFPFSLIKLIYNRNILKGTIITVFEKKINLSTKNN